MLRSSSASSALPISRLGRQQQRCLRNQWLQQNHRALHSCQPDGSLQFRSPTASTAAATEAAPEALPESTSQPASGFGTIPEALREIAAGNFVVVTDDADRENEGDLIIAAGHMTPEKMHFMVQHTSGYIVVGMTGEDLDRLRIPLMVPPRNNEEAMRTAFTVTVDVREGTTTGISASDRSATCVALADPAAQCEDFNQPGHVGPLRARDGGVLQRRGHTEAAVDLSRLAGCSPVGVLCEIVDQRDGSMARTPQLLEFAKQHRLVAITIDDLARYIRQQ